MLQRASPGRPGHSGQWYFLQQQHRHWRGRRQRRRCLRRHCGRHTNYSGFCANVSTGPNLGNPIQPDNQNGIASKPVYVNLGNGRCDVTQEIVTHEFGHALGLAYHFDGFGGDGPAIASTFWDVLATLYGNPQSTVSSNLAVRRAAN